MNYVGLMFMFVMSGPITVFMLLDAICTLKDLDLRFWGQKHVFCRYGLMNVRLSEKIPLKRDLGRNHPEHFAWDSLQRDSSGQLFSKKNLWFGSVVRGPFLAIFS